MVAKKKPKAKKKTVKPGETRNTPSAEISPYRKQFAIDPEDIDPKTGQGRRKSMFDMCDDYLQVYAHSTTVHKLMEAFDCSSSTVNRCIADVHVMWAEAINTTRAKRMERYARRQDEIYRRALRSGELSIADKVTMNQAELQGDKKPDVHLLLGGDPAALIAQSRELAKLSEETED